MSKGTVNEESLTLYGGCYGLIFLNESRWREHLGVMVRAAFRIARRRAIEFKKIGVDEEAYVAPGGKRRKDTAHEIVYASKKKETQIA